jgi:hypothetical protein
MRAKDQSLRGMLIAPDGRWLRDGSREFLRLLGDPEPDYDAKLFAVLNMGFIYLRRKGTLLEIIVHPRNACSSAVDAVIPLIGSSGAKVFTIKYHGRTEWQQEISASAQQTCRRLFELCQVGDE